MSTAATSRTTTEIDVDRVTRVRPRRSKAKAHMRMLCRGDVRGPVTDYARWCWSSDAASGYRVHLDELAPATSADLDYTLAPLTLAQAERAFDTTGLSKPEAREVDTRRRLWDSGIGTCWAATTDDGTVAYLGWGIDGAIHASHVEQFFGSAFLPLGDDEILIEGAWTHPDHRGKLLNTAVVHQILTEARSRGLTYGVTYCSDDNIPSFMSVRANGFRRFIQRQDRWRCFRSNPTWTPTDVEIELPPREN